MKARLSILSAALLAAVGFASAASAADFRPGVAFQPSGLCQFGVTFDDAFSSLNRPHTITIRTPTVRGLNVSTGLDSQRVNYAVYLTRWDGSRWQYTQARDFGSDIVYEGRTISAFPGLSTLRGPSPLHNISTSVLTIPAAAASYSVWVSLVWTSRQTGRTVRSDFYRAPLHDEFGGSGWYCMF